MPNIQTVGNNTVISSSTVENGASEAVDLIQERAGTSLALMKTFKERNSGLISRILNKREAQVIGNAEVEIIVNELESQKRELEVLQTGRLKALQKIIESKLMYMNSTLHVDLSRAYKKHEAILLKDLDQAEIEFQRIIETFAERIETYKIAQMKQRALLDLEMQINSFYSAKEKLFNDYLSLIENLKFPTGG